LFETNYIYHTTRTNLAPGIRFTTCEETQRVDVLGTCDSKPKPRRNDTFYKPPTTTHSTMSLPWPFDPRNVPEPLLQMLVDHAVHVDHGNRVFPAVQLAVREGHMNVAQYLLATHTPRNAQQEENPEEVDTYNERARAMILLDTQGMVHHTLGQGGPHAVHNSTNDGTAFESPFAWWQRAASAWAGRVVDACG